MAQALYCIIVAALFSLSMRAEAYGLPFLNGSEIKALSKTNKTHYIFGLRLIAADIDRYQRRQAGKKKPKERSRGSSAFRLPLFTPAARAESDAGAANMCLYAGWLTTYLPDGKYCRPPEQGACTKGMVQCNPLLFGNGVCTQKGIYATKICRDSAQPAAVVAGNLDEKSIQNLMKFQDDLNAYCEKGKQVEICAMIRHRLDQMSTVFKEETRQAMGKSQPRQTPGADAPAADRTATAESDGSAPARGRSERSGNAGAPAGGRRNTVDRCHSSMLISPAETGNASGAYEMVLQPPQAQNLLCSNSPVNTGLVQSRRRFLDARKAEVNRVAGSPAAKGYYTALLSSLQSNLDHCLKEAQSLRQKPRPDVPQNVVVEFKNNSVAHIQTESRRGYIVTQAGYVAPSLRLEGVTDICAVRFQGQSSKYLPGPAEVTR